MKDEKYVSLGQSIAQLDEDWKRVTSSLHEKEESVKISLNKWMDFQRQLTHLVDTDSWFATREAAMSKYQHISTEKDRNIALEDVKVNIKSLMGLEILRFFPGTLDFIQQDIYIVSSLSF